MSCANTAPDIIAITTAKRVDLHIRVSPLCPDRFSDFPATLRRESRRRPGSLTRPRTVVCRATDRRTRAAGSEQLMLWPCPGDGVLPIFPDVLSQQCLLWFHDGNKVNAMEFRVRVLSPSALNGPSALSSPCPRVLGPLFEGAKGHGISSPLPADFIPQRSACCVRGKSTRAGSIRDRSRAGRAHQESASGGYSRPY